MKRYIFGALLHWICISITAPLSVAGINQQVDTSIKLMVEVSAGDLFDKFTILQIKTERIKNEKKLKNIWNELHAIKQVINAHVPPSIALDDLVAALKKTNETLWTIEDDIREKEAKKEFDAKFIELARSVYITNDKRCYYKRKINELLGSRLFEEKQYTEYETI